MWEKWEYIYSQQRLYTSLLVFPLHGEWNVREIKRKAAWDVWPRWTRVLALELVAMPGHGAQISARAPTKGYIQTGAHARARFPN